ncbi:type I-E CRISPR-associated protein Cse2/CasB [Lacticaseibacillus parakribbianus]|uniref:type I-E CRISPR-associated protein Cse2/CasB n=1 Tax=Lacticaseibacillus parakribbianus TaxID=2970927 RepID=UPI0021CB8FFC|nr:type I-E CRISPR-associated protein Cse2/CasB [Lacticaseibacillus parakribbianus]
MGDSTQQAATAILSQLAAGGSSSRAILASLRGASSLASPRAQAVWPLMLSAMPAALLSRTGEPTSSEAAIFTALRLFALVQQGRVTGGFAPLGRGADPTAATESVGVSLFAALGAARPTVGSPEALDRRVRAVLGASNFASVVDGLTHLVAILKGTKVIPAIDYAQLAGDLASYQISFEQASRVKLRWGQAYYHTAEQVKGAN